MKKTLTTLLAFVAFMPLFAQNLSIERNMFAPAEVIHVHFTAPNGLAEDAWIGIVPSGIAHGKEKVNDEHDLAYQYLKGRTTGTLTFKAPAKNGSYDLRMHDTDDNGIELTSISFEVFVDQNTLGNDASLSLSRDVFEPGESISLYFTAPNTFPDNAWIGIIPSNIPHGNETQNDEHDISYQYIQKRTTGSLTFQAPEQPGKYDFRMHSSDNNGREVFSVTFIVE